MIIIINKHIVLTSRYNVCFSFFFSSLKPCITVNMNDIDGLGHIFKLTLGFFEPSKSQVSKCYNYFDTSNRQSLYCFVGIRKYVGALGIDIRNAATTFHVLMRIPSVYNCDTEVKVFIRYRMKNTFNGNTNLFLAFDKCNLNSRLAHFEYAVLI